MAAHIEVTMHLKTRPAIYTPACDRPTLDLKKGQAVRVDVFGIYQVAVDDDVDAYFVVQLPDGRCTYVGVCDIRFTDVALPEKEARQ